ncbi:MAG: hypothetical protein RLO17_10290 [Cyclobacteriaceae bacterium]
MKSSQYTLTIILILILGPCFFTSNAQDMQEQFREFKSDASKWQEYTMFKHHELDQFWKVVSDTLNKNQTDLMNATNKINALSSRLDSIGIALQETKAELDASEDVNSSIGFLGIQINKVMYNIVIWSIIAGLCAAIGMLYVMYTTSNKVTRSTKKEFSQLATEFSDYKEKATKKQISLKRELQTAINTLEDNRIKVSQKLGYNKDSSTIS